MHNDADDEDVGVGHGSLGRVARNAHRFERHALVEAADERRGMWRRGGGVGALFPEFSAASGGRSPGTVLQIDFQPTPTRASSSAAPPEGHVGGKHAAQ